MCPGINSFTFGAVHRPGRRGSHTSQKARCMRHPRLVLFARAHPIVGNEAGMCPGINRFTKCAPIADWCVGEYLYGAPVLVPAELGWVGREGMGRKGPTTGAAQEPTREHHKGT